jgi:chromosome segregation ATPase
MTLNKDKVVKHIDYLQEDPPLSGQLYGLISIVGPHVKQKADIWGIKIRGVADSLDRAKALTKRIMRADNNFDIYTVEIGKFFPLNVEPYDIQDIEYENEELNNLVKSYLENKEKANEHWHERKRDMMDKAILEGKNQEEMASRPEHPIAVLQRIKNLDSKREEILKDLESVELDIKASKDKFETYTEEERELADTQLKKAIEENIDPEIPETKEKTIEEIRNEIMKELEEEQQEENNTKKQTTTLEQSLEKLKEIDLDLNEYNDTLKLIDKTTSPNVYERLESKIKTLELKKKTLVQTLNDAKSINQYINSNYNGKEGDYHGIF